MTQKANILKVGGAGLDDPGYLDLLLKRVASLEAAGPVVLVHGGGCEIGDLQKRLGMTPRTEQGLRITTREAMSVVTMVLCGLVNKRVVAHFVHAGIDAIGLCGADRGLLRAPFYGKGELGRVGGAPVVDPALLAGLLASVRVLVLSPVCLGPDGGLLNVNADTVAQAVAIALGAEVLEFVTDVDAVRSDTGPERSLTPPQVERLLREDIVRGGMRPKMLAALAALAAGVLLVRVGSLSSLQSGEATEVRP